MDHDNETVQIANRSKSKFELATHHIFKYLNSVTVYVACIEKNKYIKVGADMYMYSMSTPRRLWKHMCDEVVVTGNPGMSWSSLSSLFNNRNARLPANATETATTCVFSDHPHL